VQIQGLCRNTSSEILLGQGGKWEGSTNKQNMVFLPKPYAFQHSIFAMTFFQFYVQRSEKEFSSFVAKPCKSK